MYIFVLYAELLDGSSHVQGVFFDEDTPRKVVAQAQTPESCICCRGECVNHPSPTPAQVLGIRSFRIERRAVQ